MVKKWITISVIFVALVVGCAFEYNYVNKSFDYLHNELASYRLMLEENEDHIDSQENITFIEELHESWHKKVAILKALIWHTGIKDIEVGLSRIKTYTEENNVEEARTELEALIDYVQHYSDDFDLSLGNIL